MTSSGPFRLGVTRFVKLEFIPFTGTDATALSSCVGWPSGIRSYSCHRSSIGRSVGDGFRRGAGGLEGVACPDGPGRSGKWGSSQILGG